ncbi:unnamed protein product [Vicia faba]|uniref:Uncharacterized protein n=1 Tax=Vicia faba TaxID=3906 RepID=A0AAV1AHA4_VICFA|nr:unnamed protein product [Vicia faba]
MSSGTVNFPAILVTVTCNPRRCVRTPLSGRERKDLSETLFQTRESTFPYEHSIGRLRVRRGSLLCLHTRLPFSESSAGPPATSLRPEGFIAQKRRDAGSRRGKPNECLCRSSTGIDRRLRERELHAFYRIFRSVRATREYGDGSFHPVLDIKTHGSRPFGHTPGLRRPCQALDSTLGNATSKERESERSLNSRKDGSENIAIVTVSGLRETGRVPNEDRVYLR